MSLTGRIGGRTRPAVGAALALLLVAGCGGATAPEEAVPELSTRLSAVDQALADHEFSQARRQIARLVRATRAARATGELEAAEAEPILDAAASLVSALPRESPDRSSQPPATQPDTDEGEQPLGENAGEGEQAREKRQEELQKKLEEKQKKDEDEGHGQGGGEEGGGNGESGESGHGD